MADKQVITKPAGRALLVAVQFGLRATYDAQYVALSDVLGLTLWTADERLFNAVAADKPFVHLLREYQT